MAVCKSRELDAYRWALLRQRHGRFGSALRLTREMLSDTFWGWCAKRRLALELAAAPCDFLLLQSAPKVIAFQRKKNFMQALRERGHCLIETALPTFKTLLAERLLQAPTGPVPLRYFIYAAHAQWLIQTHRPKILLNDRNGSLYAPFLRLALHRQGGLLVHLAHATTVESSSRLGMNDYDYYFLFGRSSLEALQARSLRFGTSTAVLAGSHMVDTAYELPVAEPRWRRVLVLGVGPDKEKEPGYQQTYALLREWGARQPQYRLLIKAHPRSQVPFWQEAAGDLPNVDVLPAGCSLAQALAQASIVINIMSNAVIEAALARRPVIYVNASGQHDIFAQEAFFGACITSVDALERRMAGIEADYTASVAMAERFADHHLAEGCRGLERNLQLLERLLESGTCEGIVLPSAGLGQQERALS